jgi:hypothetical protein
MVTFWLISTSVSNIKVIDVFIHHHHNLLVQDNNVAVNNDVNGMFGKALIDVYLLGVFNPKGHSHKIIFARSNIKNRHVFHFVFFFSY